MRLCSRKRIESFEKYFNSSLCCEKGAVALILVLWVMVILMAMVVQFTYSVRTDFNITRNFKEEEEAYQLALAGIEKAKAEILSMKNPADMYMNEEGVLVFNEEEEEGEESPVREGTLGRGSYSYIIEDEDGKLNINTATVAQLKYVFLKSDIDITEVDEIVDSIIDWRDKNDLHMLNGAEEDYYRSLPEPYSCKDGKFDVLDELLLVKGMTEELFYGSEATDDEEIIEGVAKYFTVTGSNTVNLNTASMIVLETFFGNKLANDIMNQREAGRVTRTIASGKLFSDFFNIISTGTNIDGSIRRSVKTVVQRKSEGLEVIYWNDNFLG